MDPAIPKPTVTHHCFDENEITKGKPTISILWKYEDFCVLKVTRGFGPRAVEEWIHQQSEGDCFSHNCGESVEGRNRKRPRNSLARDAVIANPHYSAYARSLILVARNRECQNQIQNLKITIHCLCRGKMDRKERILEENLNGIHCRLKVQSLRNVRSNAVGFITLIEATNLSCAQGSCIIQPRQFRRQLKVANLPVLGSAKDAKAFRGESLCMSVIQLQFEFQHNNKKEAIKIEIPPASRLQTVLEREQRFYNKKSSFAEHPITDDTDGYNLIPMPNAYQKGSVVFDGLEFSVTPHVMIPRTGSEVVVNRALDLFSTVCHLHNINKSTTTVLDLGTGSGCLLLSLLHRMPQARGIGIDNSLVALGVAKGNASKLGLSARSLFQEGTFCKLPSIWKELLPHFKRVDIIVCNPPYHTQEGRKHQMDLSSITYEPASALFVNNNENDKIIHYRHVLEGLRDVSHSGTVLVFEVFKHNAQRVSDLMIQEGLKQVQIGKDSNGCIRTVEGVFCQ